MNKLKLQQSSKKMINPNLFACLIIFVDFLSLLKTKKKFNISEEVLNHINSIQGLRVPEVTFSNGLYKAKKIVLFDNGTKAYTIYITFSEGIWEINLELKPNNVFVVGKDLSHVYQLAISEFKKI